MASKFDFESLYLAYPRKGEGKTKGMEKLVKTARNEKDYGRFVMAVSNYIKLCESDARERQFIKMWSTFVNNREDYENAEHLGLEPDSSSGLRVVT